MARGSASSEDESLINNNLTPAEKEKKGYINVVILGVSFCVLFIAFSACQNLATKINGDLGFYSLSVLYSVFAPANFISPYIVQVFGEKVSLLFGAVCYCIFIAANIKVEKPTLLGGSAIIGFGAAVLWTAQGSTVIHNAPAEKLGAFNGLFFGVFQWSQVIGNLLAGILLSNGISDFWLFTILTIVGSTSIIGFLCIRPPPGKSTVTPKEKQSLLNKLSQTFKVMATKPMALLYLAMIYSGISQTYFFGIFTKDLPKKQLGYIMATFGLADVLGSFAAGWISDKISGLPVIFFCALSMSAGSISLFLQQTGVVTSDVYLSYIIAILLGIADSGFNTQLYSIIGVVFHDRVEAAIGVLKFFQAASTAILFFLGTHVGNTFYLVIVLFTLWSGTLFFFVLNAITPKPPKKKEGIINP